MAEVRRRLSGAGYRADLVEGAIERMMDLGMLDDEAFARNWVESRDRARPRGERAIRAELAFKGVDRASVDLVLEERREAAASAPDAGAAANLLERHRHSLGRLPDPRKRRQRAYSLLARHGFDPETCAGAVNAVLEWGTTEDRSGPVGDPDPTDDGA